MPRVHAVEGADMVMDRIDGIDSLTQLTKRESFVHGDLHPGNVLLTATGPIVIDWEGAGVGASDAEVATTWLLLDTARAFASMHAG